jgi:hypothetical protein
LAGPRDAGAAFSFVPETGIQIFFVGLEQSGKTKAMKKDRFFQSNRLGAHEACELNTSWETGKVPAAN